MPPEYVDKTDKPQGLENSSYILLTGPFYFAFLCFILNGLGLLRRV